ncbi:MAG: GxxExxY protein [Flavobacteriales bacterium]
MSSQDPETFAIIGAAMEVHAHLGHGFLENVYHDASAKNSVSKSLTQKSPSTLTIKGYRRKTITARMLVCYGSIIVELKALQRLSNTETSLLLNYLKASSLQRGLLLNFGAANCEYTKKGLELHQ